MKTLALLVLCLLLSGCFYAVKVKHCTPDGACTTFKSKKDHSDGITVKYNPETGQFEYQSASSVTNTADLAAMVQILNMVASKVPGG